MPADPDRRPRLFSLSEGEERLADFNALSYETMSEEGRCRALDYYEIEIGTERYQREYLTHFCHEILLGKILCTK